jgi:hypothetical protein
VFIVQSSLLVLLFGPVLLTLDAYQTRWRQHRRVFQKLLDAHWPVK